MLALLKNRLFWGFWLAILILLAAWQRDRMWNNIVAPWPDLAVGTIEIRDLVNIVVGTMSLIVGAIGSYLAWLSIKMGREQDAVTTKQTALLEKLEELERKQAAIAEEQHQLLERDRTKRAVLKLLVPLPPSTRIDGPTTYEIFIVNDGDKAETGYWFLGVPKRLRGRITFEPKPGNEQVQLAADNWEIVGNFDQPLVTCFADDYYLVKFKTTVPVEPGVPMPCGSATVQWDWSQSDWQGQTSIEARDQGRRILLWFTNKTSGRFPERGMKKLRLYGRWDAAFKNYHGGRELPVDDPDDIN